MRIYGSSPLYNYVELVFRCKRMFIISIVLGTVIASVMVATRAASFTTSILIGLTGEFGDVSTDSRIGSPIAAATPEKDNTPSRRKMNRLAIWLTEKPSFLEEVVVNSQLDKRYPNKTVEELARQIRKNIAEPVALTDQYVSLKLTWPRADESEMIMRTLFTRFYDMSLATDTATVTKLRQVVADQYAAAELEANRQAQRRIAYQTKHYNSISTMLGAQIGRSEQSQTQLEDARLDLSDAQTRLADIESQIKNVPQEIVEQRQEGGQTENPLIQMSAEYDDMSRQMKQLLGVYSAQHPKVIDLQKRMAALTQQIEEKKLDLKSKPQGPKTTTSLVTKTSNPEYRDLMQQKRELQRTVSAQTRRVSMLGAILTSSRANIQSMTPNELEWQKIESDYQLADTIRRNRKAQLAQLKLDEDKEKQVKGSMVKLEVPPKAEKAESSGKTIALYALGPLLGIVIAFCFSLLVETMDHTLRTPVEVEKYLNKPVLAVIPRMTTARDGHKQLGGASKPSISS